MVTINNDVVIEIDTRDRDIAITLIGYKEEHIKVGYTKNQYGERLC